MKKILIFTGTRADYGLLYPLISNLKKDTEFQVELLVTGSHLSEKFGLSIKEIQDDGFDINYKVDLHLTEDSELQTINSMATGLIKYTEVLNTCKPDVAIVLGDRYEALMFAISCQVCKVTLTHIHGGEVTEGAIDEAFRHSITKLSYLHFTAAEVYAKRVIQLGESPDRVFNTGALGIDNIINLKKISKTELQDKFKINFKKINFLITFHPETLSERTSKQQIDGLLKALILTKKHLADDCFFIFTMPNSDPGHNELFDLINNFVFAYNANSVALTTMGRVNYLSAMAVCDAVIGNSSSGVIEAPSFNVPTVDIGFRQAGRLKATSIFQAGFESKEIYESILKCLDFKIQNKKTESFFGNGLAAEKMKSILKTTDFSNNIQKSFYDRH